MAGEPKRVDRGAGGELVIPIMAVAFTLYFFSTILNSPWTAQVNAFLIGGVLLALCIGIFIRTGLAVRAGRATLGFGKLISSDDLASGRVGLLLATIGYVWFIDEGGFTLTTFCFLAASMAILSRGKRLGLILGVCALLSLGGWALFIWAFDTRFPRGWFENMMLAVGANG